VVQTPLHFAASSGCLSAVRLLAERGADVNAFADLVGGTTPFACARMWGRCAVASALVAHGATTDAPSWTRLPTVLVDALWEARRRAVWLREPLCGAEVVAGALRVVASERGGTPEDVLRALRGAIGTMDAIPLLPHVIAKLGQFVALSEALVVAEADAASRAISACVTAVACGGEGRNGYTAALCVAAWTKRSEELKETRENIVEMFSKAEEEGRKVDIIITRVAAQYLTAQMLHPDS
jgi:hypothetical protein